jgi:hypothetical protein
MTKRPLTLLTLLTLSATAQQPWQHLNNPTTSQIRTTWTTPPSIYGPEPYYGLNGPVDLTTIQRDLDTMKSLGYGAVTVQYGYGSAFPYLSPEYFTFFKSFVQEAKKRDLHLWIVDDAGYPSGFAGGKFSSDHPELRMQALAVTARIPAPANQITQIPLKPETVAVTALNNDTGATLAVPFTGPSTTWSAPAGNWTVLVVEHIFSTSPTRSDTNPKRVKDGSQSLEDYLDPAATAQFLAFTHQAYKHAVGDEFGKTILGFRGDEPDYSIAGLPWTPKFFPTFERLKGYDIRPYVATFLPTKGATLNLTEQQKRAKADYYDVFSQLFRDGFFKPQADWCAANHLEYQVHLNHEEMELQLTRSEGEFFRDMRYVQIPGIDSIWHQIWTDTISDFPRLAASAAHVYGHPRAFTESFAAYRPEPDVTMARYILNEQFVRGINLVETMYFPATSTPGKGGPAAYMRDPAYPALLTYVRRMSYLMSQGRPDASVALFLPSSSLWLGNTAADTAFVSTERLLSEQQIDFDIVDEDALATFLTAGKGTLTTASGNTFRTVILPSPYVLSQSAMTRLQAFAKGGGKVLFLGDTPKRIAGRTILDARPATPADFSWASVETSAQLPETPTPPPDPPTTPPAPLVVPPAVLTALIAATGPQTLSLEAPDPALRLTRRRWKDATLYLLFNESAIPMTHTLTLPSGTRSAQTWDPQTGQTAPAIIAPQSHYTLTLAPYATQVLVLQ